MKSMRYNPKAIEAKWQKKWAKDKIYEPNLAKAQKPYYNLMMFPYPSAEGLHVGNMYAFAGSDIYGRFQRMRGHDVFEPIGLDGFGIHSENYALKIGKHPAEQSKVSEKNFYRQLSEIGNGFAWNEHLETYDPDYYKWTQWIFAEMFKKGLAYRKKSKVNWCPSCKTVLADEQVIQGRCERCSSEVIKKDLEQWFFRITNYAERLLENLEKIDWSPRVKIAQENWIGKSEGALLKFPISNSQFSIDVFTTRPDTLFGATYMVLAPEHKLIENLKLKIKNWGEVEKYIKTAAKKTEIERTADTKDKTGVELKGVKAINPATKEEIPIWVADYVLAGYGTGAIMAVPAHDERDFVFAKKFNLPVIQVILKAGAPIRSYLMGADKITDNELIKLGIKIIEKTKDGDRKIEIPETSIKDYEVLINQKLTLGFWNEYIGRETVFIFKHKNDKLERIVLNKATESRIDKLAAEFVGEGWDKSSVWRWLAENDWYADTIIHTENGKLINSEKFSDIDSETAKKKITEFVGGKMKVQYRLRDWLISRQRYWGPPIPMIFCENCADKIRNQESGVRNIFNKGELENPGWIAVPEKDLPVRLPFVKNFRPTGTGESPLASVKSFYETKCSKCKGKARRETDVSDTFLDSAWYFIGYLMTFGNWKLEIGNSAFSRLARKWLPVDMYIGGAEHSVLHLLYSRFLTMVFHDWGLLDFEEPYKKFRAHGLIIKDGAKMSKSKGNIVNPDDYIKAYGADALRLYLMFTGPFQDGGDFRDAGITGMTRFLQRVWRLFDQQQATNNKRQGVDVLVRVLHHTIKKVTEDIEGLRYNTAISALMILLNEFEAKSAEVLWKDLKIFLQLLAPFAPHITEELYQQFFVNPKSQTLNSKQIRKYKSQKSKQFHSIHNSLWPAYDPKKIESEEIDLVVQVNGRVRGRLRVLRGINEAEAVALAQKNSGIAKYLTGAPKKTIFVPGRLINFVF